LKTLVKTLSIREERHVGNTSALSEWAVLYVRAGSERRIAGQLSKHLNGARYVPFVPVRVKAIIKNGGVDRREAVLCFPGYVFIRINAAIEDFFREVHPLASVIGGAYYFVCYGGDKKDVVMRRDERVNIESLMNEEFCIEASKGVMDGGKVRIIEGSLMGAEGRIVKVFRNKRVAVVDMPFMGGSRQVPLMLEIIENSDKYSN
jgi:transcriptional antiterminator NusG